MKRILSAISLSLLFVAPSMADVVAVSNLDETPFGIALVENIFSPREGVMLNRSIAQRFTTGADVGYSLTSVTIRSGGATADNGNFSLTLFSDSHDIPVLSLQALTGSAAPAPAGLYNYTLGSPLPLSPLTSYWIVAEVPLGAAQTGYGWSVADSVAETGLPGWTMGPLLGRQRVDGGAAAWTPFSSSFRVLMEIGVVAPVPEVSPFAMLLVVGGAAIAWAAIRRT